MLFSWIKKKKMHMVVSILLLCFLAIIMLLSQNARKDGSGDGGASGQEVAEDASSESLDMSEGASTGSINGAEALLVDGNDVMVGSDSKVAAEALEGSDISNRFLARLGRSKRNVSTSISGGLALFLQGDSDTIHQLQLTLAEIAGMTEGEDPMLMRNGDVAGNLELGDSGEHIADNMGMNAGDGASFETEENEYSNLAIAQVNDYVNVRKEPNTDSEIMGKMYNGSVAEILSVEGEDSEWLHVKSGQVEGYIKSEYFVWGENAREVIDEYITWDAVIDVERLNIRSKPDSSSSRVSFGDQGEKLKVVGLWDAAEELTKTENVLAETNLALKSEDLETDDCNTWLEVKVSEDQGGFIAARYVSLSESFIYAKSIEEEREEQRRLEELKAREKKKENESKESTKKVPTADITYSDHGELRSNLVNYALGYVGYPYVHGGTSLATGTDCSGFTCFIYKDYGYSISRTPSGQYSSAGRSVGIDEIQIGDIVCYGKSSCTHVGIYIGGGQIVHAANSRKGVVVYDMYYDNILGVRNVID